jgi:hypothetical protein
MRELLKKIPTSLSKLKAKKDTLPSKKKKKPTTMGIHSSVSYFSTKAKPCPFCGAPGAIYRWSFSLFWTAKCTLPGCGAGWENYFKSEGAAYKHWNRRIHRLHPKKQKDVKA